VSRDAEGLAKSSAQIGDRRLTPLLPLRLNDGDAAGENPRHALVIQSLRCVGVQVVVRIPVKGRVREHECPIPVLPERPVIGPCNTRNRSGC